MVLFHHAYAEFIQPIAFQQSDLTTYFFVQPLLTGGWLGVNIFFVLSGFVLFLPICKGDVLVPSEFLQKRARRLLPLYYLNVLICLILSMDHSTPELLQRAITYAFVLFPRPGWFFPPENPPLWSLGVEIWYSALLPFLLLAMGRAGIRKTLLWTIGFSAIIHAIGLAALHDHKIPLNVISDSLPGRLSDFCIGMLAAYGWVRVPALKRHGPLLLALTVVLLASMLLAIAAWRAGDLPPWSQTFWSLGFAAGVARLILALQQPETAPIVRRALEFAPLQVIGMMCFSIYIWHWLLLHAVTTLHGSADWVFTGKFGVYLVLLLLISAFSYRFIEFGHVGVTKLFLIAPTRLPRLAGRQRDARPTR